MTRAGASTAAPRSGASGRICLASARVGLAVGVLVAWQLAATYLFDPLTIASPAAIAIRLWTGMFGDDALFANSWVTVSHALEGLALSFAVGVPVGILFAWAPFLAEVVEPFFLGLYSLPRVALAPLFILWLGIGEISKVAMTFSMVVFVVVLNTQEGLRTIDRELLEMMAAMRARPFYRLRKLLLPAIVPWLLTALRVGIGLALVGSVVGELLGANQGLGWYIEYSAARIDVAGVFAGLVILMAVGMVLNELIEVAEARLWQRAG